MAIVPSLLLPFCILLAASSLSKAWTTAPSTIAIGRPMTTRRLAASMRTRHLYHHQQRRTTSRTTAQRMAAEGSWLDNLTPDFLKQRDGDFIQLQDSEKAFGPGPLLILFRAPSEIEDEEIRDMLTDGAPTAARQGVTLYRLAATDDSVLDLTLQEALDQIMTTSKKGGRGGADGGGLNNSFKGISPISSSTPTSQDNQGAVLLFSGFSNPEMLALYNILGPEIYQETAGQCPVACAKVMPNALSKPLRQVLDEIAGDHRDAIKADGI